MLKILGICGSPKKGATEYFLKESLDGLHNWFLKYSGGSFLTYCECIDKMVSIFVPSGSLEAFTTKQKTGILAEAIRGAFKEMIRKLSNELIAYVIDYRNDESYSLIKSDMVDLILWQKELRYHRFIVNQTKTKDNSSLSSVAQKKYEDVIKKLLEEKYEWRAISEKIKRIVVTQHEKNSKLTEENVGLQDKIRELQEKILDLGRQTIEPDIPQAPSQYISSSVPNFHAELKPHVMKKSNNNTTTQLNNAASNDSGHANKHYEYSNKISKHPNNPALNVDTPPTEPIENVEYPDPHLLDMDTSLGLDGLY